MLSDGVLANCHRLVDDIAPELSSRVAIIDSDDLPEELRQSSIMGVCMPASAAPHFVRDCLKALDLYDGYVPPTIVLYRPSIAETFGLGVEFMLGVYAVIVHEVAHAIGVQDVEIPDHVIENTDSPGVREHIAERLHVSKLVTDLAPFESKYDGHNVAFIRRVCHLHTRARLAGWQVPATGVWQRSVRHAAPEAHWNFSLIDEIFECLDLPFEEIEKRPLPELFEAEVAELKETIEHYENRRKRYADQD